MSSHPSDPGESREGDGWAKQRRIQGEGGAKGVVPHRTQGQPPDDFGRQKRSILVTPWEQTVNARAKCEEKNYFEAYLFHYVGTPYFELVSPPPGIPCGRPT